MKQQSISNETTLKSSITQMKQQYINKSPKPSTFNMYYWHILSITQTININICYWHTLKSSITQTINIYYWPVIIYTTCQHIKIDHQRYLHHQQSTYKDHASIYIIWNGISNETTLKPSNTQMKQQSDVKLMKQQIHNVICPNHQYIYVIGIQTINHPNNQHILLAS